MDYIAIQALLQLSKKAGTNLSKYKYYNGKQIRKSLRQKRFYTHYRVRPFPSIKISLFELDSIKTTMEFGN